MSADKRDSFLAELSASINVDLRNYSDSTLLAELDWDSLASISFIALADDIYGKSISGKDLAKCNSLHDLLKLLES